MATDINVATTANVSWGIPDISSITSATAPLTGAKATGNYTGDEGIEVANDISSVDITAHQHSALVRTIVTGTKATYHFVFIDNTPAIRELWFGNPEVAGKIAWKPQKRYRGNFVIDAIDDGLVEEEGTILTRHVIPDGEVTSIDSLTYTNSDATRYGVTITAYQGANGTVADIYTLKSLD